MYKCEQVSSFTKKNWTHETKENFILNGNCFQTYLPFSYVNSILDLQLKLGVTELQSRTINFA